MKLQRWAGVSRIVIDHNAPCAKFAYVQAGKTGFFVPEHKHISHTPSVPGTAPPLRCKVCIPSSSKTSDFEPEDIRTLHSSKG